VQEKINFIKSVSRKRQKEYRRWFIISCSLYVAVLLFIGIVQAKQLITYWQAKQTYASAKQADETVFKKQHELKKQLQQLQKKQQDIQRYEKDLQAMQQKVVRINKLQHYGQIESILITKQKTDAILALTTFKQVQTLLQVAQKQQDFEIVNIQPKQQHFYVTIQLI